MSRKVLCSEAFNWMLSPFTSTAAGILPAPVTHSSPVVSQRAGRGSGLLPGEGTRIGLMSEDLGTPLPTLDLLGLLSLFFFNPWYLYSTEFSVLIWPV